MLLLKSSPQEGASQVSNSTQESLRDMERVVEVWNNIPSEVCQNLIESMPRRLKAVIEAKGGHTKY